MTAFLRRKRGDAGSYHPWFGGNGGNGKLHRHAKRSPKRFGVNKRRG